LDYLLEICTLSKHDHHDHHHHDNNDCYYSSMSLPACTLSIQTAQTGPYPYEPVLMPIHKNNTAISTAVKVTGEWQAILQFVANALYTTYIYIYIPS